MKLTGKSFFFALGIFAFFTLISCDNKNISGPTSNDENVCVGGEFDGKICSDSDSAKRCEDGGGVCVDPKLIVLNCSPTTDGNGNNTGDCYCKCSNLTQIGNAVCMDNLKEACRAANNCNVNDCDDDGCTYTNSTDCS